MNMKNSIRILHDMMQGMQQAPKIYQPSPFWSALNSSHWKEITSYGINNFKGSINMHYFNWSIWKILVHQLTPLISEISKGNFSPLFHSRLISGNSDFGIQLKNNPISSFIYRVYIAAFFDYLKRQDHLDILNCIEEPNAGKPVKVHYKKKGISQDLCNSVQEFYSIINSINYYQKFDIGEIGAGYGRLAYVFLKILPNSTYCIIDTPPALYLAQQYLTTIFPQARRFHYRPFHSYQEVKNEFEAAKIKFLLPHQIELLPNHIFNLMVNISSLHEMTTAQIYNYIKQIQRLCQGYFYTKQWRKSRTKDNNYIKGKDYPIPKKWEIIFQHRHPIQWMFFEALYKTY